MDRRTPYGAPSGVAGPGQGGHAPQQGRSGFAEQPATNPVKINLKKATVKVVRPANQNPAPGPVKSVPKAEEGYGASVKDSPNKTSFKFNPEAAPVIPVTNTDFVGEKDPILEKAATLAAMHARLNASRSSPAPNPEATTTESMGKKDPVSKKDSMSEKDPMLEKATALASLHARLNSPRPVSPSSQVGSSQSSSVAPKVQSPTPKPATPTNEEPLKTTTSASAQSQLTNKVNNVSLHISKLNGNMEPAQRSKTNTNSPAADFSNILARLTVAINDLKAVQLAIMTFAQEHPPKSPSSDETMKKIQQVVDILRRVYTGGAKADPGYARVVTSYCNSLGKSKADVRVASVDGVLADSNGDFWSLLYMLIHKGVFSEGEEHSTKQDKTLAPREEELHESLGLSKEQLQMILGLCREIIDFDLKHTKTIAKVETVSGPVPNCVEDETASAVKAEPNTVTNCVKNGQTATTVKKDADHVNKDIKNGETAIAVKTDSNLITNKDVKKDEAAAAVKAETKPVFSDPMDKAIAWPTQEKRDNTPECRTCILKNVPLSATTHQLQGLVWGGVVESITRSDPNSTIVLVKFLTAPACDKFYKATANGIIVPGTEANKSVVIQVEKHPGPNSVNDLVLSCIVNGVTRCVRAYDADEDWQYPALLRLARVGGTSERRDVDHVFKGKTEKGRHFVEFRFACIYHAINFRRYLQAEEDWEHCTFVYAPDPCALAQGVHIVLNKPMPPSEKGSVAGSAK